MKEMVAVILAAGRGTRMKSDIPKVLHEILGRPIISSVIASVKDAGIKEIVTVIGYGSEKVAAFLKGAKTVVQKELRGSGDAVGTVRKELGDYDGNVLIVCGDTPLIRGRTMRDVIERHNSTDASMTILTAVLKDPTGYGRIKRDGSGVIVKIVEEERAQLYEEVINEVNVGTYCFKAKALFGALDQLKPDNNKKELFLTDTVEVLRRKNAVIESVTLKDPGEMIGINSRKDLAEATLIRKGMILDEIMAGGVTVEDPVSTTIYEGVEIGRDTVIYPNTIIETGCKIGRNCRIGPFARLRPDVRIEDGAEIGNFVELVRTQIGAGSKVKHHTYLGDATVGKNVNIGAGTITANYDGKAKSRTVIEDGAFVGVGAIFIAPVKVGKGATVGAGCVVPKNKNVPKLATVVGVPARILKKGKAGKAGR